MHKRAAVLPLTLIAIGIFAFGPQISVSAQLPPARLVRDGIEGALLGALSVDLHIDQPAGVAIHGRRSQASDMGLDVYGNARRGEVEVGVDTGGIVRTLAIPLRALSGGLTVEWRIAGGPPESRFFLSSATTAELQHGLPECRAPEPAGPDLLIRCGPLNFIHSDTAGPIFVFFSRHRRRSAPAAQASAAPPAELVSGTTFRNIDVDGRHIDLWVGMSEAQLEMAYPGRVRHSLSEQIVIVGDYARDPVTVRLVQGRVVNIEVRLVTQSAGLRVGSRVIRPNATVEDIWRLFPSCRPGRVARGTGYDDQCEEGRFRYGAGSTSGTFFIGTVRRE